MPLVRASSKHLKDLRQSRSRRGTYLVTTLVALTLIWTVLTVQRVINRYRPLPSQMRAQIQAKEIPDHLAGSKCVTPDQFPSHTEMATWLEMLTVQLPSSSFISDKKVSMAQNPDTALLMT